MTDHEFEIIQQFIGTWTKNGFKHDDQEDFWGKTLAMEIGNLSFSDFNEMSPDERELTREIIQLSNLIKSGNLTEKKLKSVKAQILRKYTLLQKAREEHEREIECNGSINDKAKLIFKRMKTPYYSDNPDQLSFDDGDVIVKVSGIQDPFYDAFKELYGEKGLYGFVDNNCELFRNISDKVIKKASNRYIKLDRSTPLFDFIWSIIGNVWVISMMIFLINDWLNLGFKFSEIAQWITIIGFVLIGLLGAPQFFRYIHNKDIFRARYKIATTLGLIKKAPIDLSDQKEIYRFDYGYNKYYFIKHQKIDKQQE